MTRALTLAALALVAMSAQAQDNARDIIKTAVAAAGGQEKLAKLRTARLKATGTLYDNGRGLPAECELLYQGDDQAKFTVRTQLDGQVVLKVEVANRGKAWWRLGNNVQQAEGPILTSLRQKPHVWRVQTLVPLLKDEAFVLSSLKESRVNGRPAVGVKVQAKGYDDIALFFDRETHLLVRFRATMFSAMHGPVVRETTFDRFKDFSGLRYPAHSVLIVGDKKLYEFELKSLEFLERIDESEFEEPKAGGRP